MSRNGKVRAEPKIEVQKAEVACRACASSAICGRNGNVRAEPKIELQAEVTWGLWIFLQSSRSSV